MNVYTHVNFDDVEEELKHMESFRLAQKEIDDKNDKREISPKMFRTS